MRPGCQMIMINSICRSGRNCQESRPDYRLQAKRHANEWREAKAEGRSIFLESQGRLTRIAKTGKPIIILPINAGRPYF